MTSSTLTTPIGRRTLFVAAGALTASLVLLGNTVHVGPATAATGWGGYTNGHIPTSALTQIGSSWLRTDAASAYGSMGAAFQKRFGKSMSLTEGYRTLHTQAWLFNARYVSRTTQVAGAVRFQSKWWTRKPGASVAAIPGTSIHGWALAADIGSGINKAGSAEKKWADANGPKFGWYPVGNNFGEAWHFEFTPPVKPAPKPTPTPTPTPSAKPTPKPTPKPSPAPAPTPTSTSPALPTRK